MLKRSGNSKGIIIHASLFNGISDVRAIRIATERLNIGPTTLKIGRAAFAPASLHALINRAAAVPIAAAASHGRGSARKRQTPNGKSQAKKYQKPGVTNGLRNAHAKLACVCTSAATCHGQTKCLARIE